MTVINTDSPTNLTPEAVVEQLRAVRSQIGEATPITPEQREAMRWIAKLPHEIVQSSVNMIDFSTNVQQALGRPASDVRGLQDANTRWSAVEDELRSLLQAVSGTNFARRHQLALISAQAYSIGTQLVRDPANAALMPHVREIKRLRGLARRGKPAQQPQPPAHDKTS
ncbi:MAG TPA: hypothetical protein VGR95_13175 [Thermoanaerobaculia bacterium]|jgi:hypothetical protein|nr:hypothetical protein [Thermoanaerobaculia bacterium]